MIVLGETGFHRKRQQAHSARSTARGEPKRSEHSAGADTKYHPPAGEVFVQMIWLSLDPDMGGRMIEVPSYTPHVKIGNAMVEGIQATRRRRPPLLASLRFVQCHTSERSACRNSMASAVFPRRWASAVAERSCQASKIAATGSLMEFRVVGPDAGSIPV